MINILAESLYAKDIKYNKNADKILDIQDYTSESALEYISEYISGLLDYEMVDIENASSDLMDEFEEIVKLTFIDAMDRVVYAGEDYPYDFSGIFDDAIDVARPDINKLNSRIEYYISGDADADEWGESEYHRMRDDEYEMDHPDLFSN